MPLHKTVFSEDWLKVKDSNGVVLEEWCEKTSSKFEALCKFCKKVVRCDNRGLSQLITHSETKLHISQTRDVFSGKQTQLQKVVVQSNSSSGLTSSLSLWSHKDSVTKAELIWSLKTAASNLSYASSQSIGDTFREMFPDSSIAGKFQMSKSKVSYMVSEATGPYFHSLLVNDLKSSCSPFSLSYDELTNKQIKKQLDIKIRYWSKEDNKVNVNHLGTHIMGQAKAKDIGECIMKSMNENGLMLKDLVTLGSDGPNVNKAVFSAVCESKKALGLPSLLDIATCPLHLVHNAFGKGISEFGQEIVDLIIDLHIFFKLSPLRKEEINDIQVDLELDELSFLKHVETRWLTLVPAAQRVISQWPALKKYFIIEIPKRDKSLSSNARYKRILKCLKDTPLKTLVQLYFIVYASRPFEKFLVLFQREEPLIHVLYEEMCTLVRSCFRRFVKTSELEKRTFLDILSLKFPCPEIELGSTELEVGCETRRVLDKMKEETQTVLLYSMRKFYHKAMQHAISKLPLQNTVIKNSSCLNLKNRHVNFSSKAIQSLAESVLLVPCVNVDAISDEWKILQCENIPEEWYFEEERDGEQSVENEEYSGDKRTITRIDRCWAKIFSLQNSLGENKFPELTRLVKAILVIPHGNADVERGFSNTSNFLTSNRSCLSSAAVSGLQSTKDGLKKFKNLPHEVPITKDFIKKGQIAYRSYQERIAQEQLIKAESLKKRAEEKEKQSKELEEKRKREHDCEEKALKAKQSIQKEKTLRKREEEVDEDLKNYTKMMEEANTRIRNALSSNDVKGAKIGQTMLEAAIKKVEKSKSTLEEIRVEQREVEKSKQTLLEYFAVSSKAKKCKTS